MQQRAFNRDRQLINARDAKRQTNYYCFECQQVVRLRGGPHRRSHFYHVEPRVFCRQNQKGPIHINLQSYFQKHLPLGDCYIEHPFPSISRIADVAWLSQKIVFEIQCSPISDQEVMERNRDYQLEGWNVVWILHDKRYNQTRCSAAEMAIRNKPHFFSNMTSNGLGMIYDQFDVCENGIRIARLPPLPVQIEHPSCQFLVDSYPLNLLSKRAKEWKIFFKGDLMSLFLQSSDAPYLNQAIAFEKNYLPSSITPWGIKFLWENIIVAPYQQIFRFLLERLCR